MHMCGVCMVGGREAGGHIKGMLQGGVGGQRKLIWWWVGGWVEAYKLGLGYGVNQGRVAWRGVEECCAEGAEKMGLLIGWLGGRVVVQVRFRWHENQRHAAGMGGGQRKW